MARAAVVAYAVAVLAASMPARAQSWEVSGLVAYTPSVDLERVAREVDHLAIRGGFTWGAQAARVFTPHWAAEVLWMQQETALEIGTADGTADLFTMTVSQLHGNVVYQFRPPDAGLRPFAFAGLGTTFFRADEVESENKLSFGFGGGLTYFPWKSIGIRAHFRYKPTWLDDEDAGDFCDPFGFCQGSLQQVETAAAVVVRF
jgi:opacity protein-like surface antigen